MQMLDMIFLILLGSLVLRGFLKGFTGEFFSIASLALAVIAAALFFRYGAAFLRSQDMQMAFVPEILSFIVIFLAVYVAGKILERIVKDIITRLNLLALDKVLGLFFGLAEGCAFIILVLFFFLKQPFFDCSEILGNSFFAGFFLHLMQLGAFHV